MKLGWYLRAKERFAKGDRKPPTTLGIAFEKAAQDFAKEAGRGFNAGKFFGHVREITGPLNQKQVDSINAILKRMDGMPLQQVAYVMATAWHEARFIPQAEWGKGAGKKYGKPGKYGQPPYGRGLVQLTWDRNYEWADRRLGLDGALLANFDLALHPEIAADILVTGMLEGAFASNGRPLTHYGPDRHGNFDYFHARQTVNVLDRAQDIADLAVQFEMALRQADYT